VRRSLKVSELTHGAFDITFASVGQLWDLTGQKSTLPDPNRLADAMRSVGALAAQSVVIPAKAWTSTNGGRFPKRAFTIDLAAAQVVCPAQQRTAIKPCAPTSAPRRTRASPRTHYR
jgi:hypothetical protein